MKWIRTLRRLAVSAAAIALAATLPACRDNVTSPSRDSRATPLEVVNAPGDPGSPETIFLAPLGPRKHPRGVLDTTLAPTVSICRLQKNECGADTVARFTSDPRADSATRVTMDDQAYMFRWKVRMLPADTSVGYRVTVTLGDTTVGFTDLKLVNAQDAAPASDTAQFAYVRERNVLNVRFQIFVPPVTLVVLVEPGVHGDLTSQTYSVRRGDRVAYEFAADSGHRNAIVTVDQNPAPKRGRILMNESHVLIASADRDPTVLARDEWILRDARAMLKAADKVRAARQLLAKLDDNTDTVNIAERLRRVELTLLQRPADAQAMAALDAALIGSSYDVGYGSGWSDGGGGGGGGEGGTATALLIPDRAGATTLRPSATVMSMSATQGEPVTIAYVNGILTTPFGALFAAHHVARIARSAMWNATVPFDVKLVYNRSAMAGDTSAEDRCILELGIKDDWLGLNSLPDEVAKCVNSTQPRALALLADFVEAGSQLSSVLNRALRFRPADADSVAAFTKRTRDKGQHLVFVMHSQGNLMVQQALSLLAERGQYSQARDTTCIGGVALASPTSRGWPIGARHLNGLAVEGDIILALGQNSFPRVKTPMSDSAGESVPRLLGIKAPALLAASTIRWAMRLHGAVDSYLAPDIMRERVQKAIVSSYRSCALGEIRVLPQSMELRTGGTGQFSATLHDLDGGPLDGQRGLAWRADALSDWQRAVSFTQDGSVRAKYVGATSVYAVGRAMSGTGGVTVSPSPMRVTATESFSARWLVLGIESTSMNPEPAFDIPETSWGGGPCREAATFTSNGRTGSFSKQCRGDYVITSGEVPEAAKYTAAVFETGSTSALEIVSNDYPTIKYTISGPSPAFDPAPGPVPLDRIVMTAYDAAGHLLARGVLCMRGCKGWPPEQ